MKREKKNLIAAIACEGQEIKLLAIRNRAMLAEMRKFRSPHGNEALHETGERKGIPSRGKERDGPTNQNSRKGKEGGNRLLQKSSNNIISNID